MNVLLSTIQRRLVRKLSSWDRRRYRVGVCSVAMVRAGARLALLRMPVMVECVIKVQSGDDLGCCALLRLAVERLRGGVD